MDSQACILKLFVYDIFVASNSFNFFRNVLNIKVIKVCRKITYFKITQRIRQNQNSSPALRTPLPTLITALPANAFLNKPALNVPNSIPRDLAFYSFISFQLFE